MNSVLRLCGGRAGEPLEIHLERLRRIQYNELEFKIELMNAVLDARE